MERFNQSGERRRLISLISPGIIQAIEGKVIDLKNKPESARTSVEERD